MFIAAGKNSFITPFIGIFMPTLGAHLAGVMKLYYLGCKILTQDVGHHQDDLQATADLDLNLFVHLIM